MYATRNAMNAVAIVQSDTTIIGPPLEAIIISATGSLVYVNDKGDTITFVCPSAANGGCYPFILPGRIRQVLAATTIGDGDLIGLRA